MLHLAGGGLLKHVTHHLTSFSSYVETHREKRGTHIMGFQQYHEPANELSQETRTFARIIVSLTEEAEAINWYEQRLAVEQNREARAIMANSQEEEFKHFGMDLEFLLRQKPKWKAALQNILFKEGDIVAHGEKGEQAEEQGSSD
jgi:uncharacterized protein